MSGGTNVNLAGTRRESVVKRLDFTGSKQLIKVVERFSGAVPSKRPAFRFYPELLL